MFANPLMTTKRLCSLLTVILLASCSTVHDGPFELVSGRPLDTERIEQLARQRVDVEEAISALGEPEKREMNEDRERLVYFSIKRRTAYESIFGIKYSQSGQDFVETAELVFRTGRLSEVRFSSEVREQ